MEDNKADNPFPSLGHNSMHEFVQATLRNVVQTTACSNKLPAVNDEHGYWESYDVFKNCCTKLGGRLLDNIGHLLQHSAIQCKWGNHHVTAGKSSADIEDQFEKLVDANDILLENVGSLLDEAAGIKKKGEEEPMMITSSLKKDSKVVSSWNKRKEFLNRSAPYKLLLAKNITRPQLRWMDKVDNSNLPFVPYIKYKPNSVNPSEDNRPDRHILEDMDQQQHHAVDLSSKHPYHYELSQFEPNSWQLEVQTPISYSPLEETELTIVDDQLSLDAMMQNLKEAREIAIDLEHHNYRSFQGIVCLIQISTRNKDYIIDSLKLRDELSVLNDVFTDSKILKVLHGSDADIGWLQRDFGVYIVNMFDTGQAARTLQEARFSLAHLLNKYCSITAQKQYQLADWRIRPLPAEMIRYAREDTHYLLYVYDLLRNQLISRGNELNNMLRLVYTKSTDISASLYKKQLYHPDSHILLYQKYKKNFNVQQMQVFRLLFQWRDKVARQEDESTGYVMPNHMMFQVAENMPKDQEGVIACCNPVPPLVNQHVSDIVRMIAEGRFYEGTAESVQDSDDEFKDIDPETRKEQSDQKCQLTTDDTKSGFEIYKITGPRVHSREPLITLFNGIATDEQIESSKSNDGNRKAMEIHRTLRSPFELYLPNTGTPLVDPKDINKTWQTWSKEKMTGQDEDRTVDISPETTSDALGSEDVIPVPSGSTVGRKRRRKQSMDMDQAEKTLREMLPQRKNKLKPLDEHLSEIASEGSEPVKLDYEKNLNNNADFVPFDYSKADLKKFNKKKEKEKKLDETEEPNVKGPIKTKVHSGARQMNF